MSSSLDAIKRVVAAFERSDWAEIDVRSGDLRVHLTAGPSVPPTDHSAPRPAPTPAGPRPADAVAAEPDLDGGTAPPEIPPGSHVVVAPSPGIFWRSPEPGAPPFADVGDTIDAAATVCIVEVMKLMNHLKAGISGEVVAVYGRNGVAVQQGEPLFAIAPAETET